MSLDATRIAALLETARYGRSLDVREETGSTNDDARAAAAAGAADGHVVVADRQHAGRGAHGRRWDSPGGTDLYLSIVARVPVAPAALPPLTLAVGLGAARALERLVPDERATLKWPNDVMLAGKKCCGILVESTSLGAKVESAVIGIGLDVNRERFGPELEDVATSLRAVRGEPFDREEVLALLLLCVEAEVDRFVTYGSRAIVGAVTERLAWRGRRVSLDDVRGELLGLRDDGALELRVEGVTRALLGGTLRLVEE